MEPDEPRRGRIGPPYSRPSYRPDVAPAPPEPPSLVERFGRPVALVAVLAVAAYLVWVWFFSSALECARVGPRPAEGGKVVLLLHGYGAPGDDFVGLAEQLEAELPGTTFLVPVGPYSVGLGGHAWLPPVAARTRAEYGALIAAPVDKTIKQIWEVIDGARKKGVLCSDITVGGFSQGGWIAAEVALRAPPDCSLGGVIVMSGGGPEIDLSPATGRPRMRVLVTHGTHDGVVSIAKGRSTAQHFAAGDHEVQWLQFDGPHTVAPAVRRAIPGFLRGETVGEIVAPSPSRE